jgi:diadenosine tetraphosphate (Ap4A) HIT family hydrolase
MPTIFTRIINGEIPGRFVWKDDDVVAFLTIEPMMTGHTLVVTREEIDHWIDVEPELNAHLFRVAQVIGKAQDAEWHPRRIGVLVMGEEVPHVHVHVVPVNHPNELTFAHAHGASAVELDDAADRVRQHLRAMGHGANVP